MQIANCEFAFQTPFFEGKYSVCIQDFECANNFLECPCPFFSALYKPVTFDTAFSLELLVLLSKINNP